VFLVLPLCFLALLGVAVDFLVAPALGVLEVLLVALVALEAGFEAVDFLAAGAFDFAAGLPAGLVVLVADFFADGFEEFAFAELAFAAGLGAVLGFTGVFLGLERAGCGAAFAV
jgi:hypothetical protein